MDLYYSKLLTRERIVEISAKYGFPDDPLVEKFIMCLEIHKRITREIRCTTGAACACRFTNPASGSGA